VQSLLSYVTSSLDTSKSMEFDDEPPPGDVVVEEADQLLANKQDDGPDSELIVRNGSLWTKKTASSL